MTWRPTLGEITRPGRSTARPHMMLATAAAVAWVCCYGSSGVAAASVTCEFRHSTGEAAVVGLADYGPVEIGLRDGLISLTELRPGDPLPLSHAVPCLNVEAGSPEAPQLTTLSVESLRFDFDGLLYVRSADSEWFSPGRSPEPGFPEIEMTAGPGVRSVEFFLGPDSNAVSLGAANGEAGINFNASHESAGVFDADFLFSAAPGVELPKVSLDARGPAGDRLLAGADNGFDAPWPGRVTLRGGPGNDMLTAGSGHASLHSGGGNNRLVGGPSRDALYACGGKTMAAGGGGDDYLVAGRNQARLSGDAGSDTGSFQCWHGTRGVSVNLDVAGSQTIGSGGAVTMEGIENLVGSDHADRLVGDGDANVIRGGLGGDIVRAKAGADTVLGQTDADFLDGGAGEDRLRAGGGQDVVTGGEGADWLFGGIGADLLRARDRLRDHRLDCGPGRGSSEAATQDGVDPPATSC